MRNSLHLVIFLTICFPWVHCKEEKSKEDLFNPGSLIKHAFQNNSMLEKITNDTTLPKFDPTKLQGHLPAIPDLNPLSNLNAKRLRELLQKFEPISYRIIQELTVFIGSQIPELFLIIYARLTKFLPEMVSKNPLQNWDKSTWATLFKKVVFDAPGADKFLPKIVEFVKSQLDKHPEILQELSPVPIPKLHL